VTTRILAIDDADVVLETYRLLLGEERVETATTTAAALERLAAADAPPVALIDLNMPGGGVPFLREVRRRFPRLVVIVLSGDAAALDARTQRELGIFRCLEKGDASFDVLERAIEEAERALEGT
jgi:DNA-binding NarL/FixJ family response regulator